MRTPVPSAYRFASAISFCRLLGKLLVRAGRYSPIAKDEGGTEALLARPEVENGALAEGWPQAPAVFGRDRLPFSACDALRFEPGEKFIPDRQCRAEARG